MQQYGMAPDVTARPATLFLKYIYITLNWKWRPVALLSRRFAAVGFSDAFFCFYFGLFDFSVSLGIFRRSFCSNVVLLLLLVFILISFSSFLFLDFFLRLHLDMQHISFL